MVLRSTMRRECVSPRPRPSILGKLSFRRQTAARADAASIAGFHAVSICPVACPWIARPVYLHFADQQD